jgi:hypothetical protein
MKLDKRVGLLPTIENRVTLQPLTAIRLGPPKKMASGSSRSVTKDKSFSELFADHRPPVLPSGKRIFRYSLLNAPEGNFGHPIHVDSLRDVPSPSLG